MGDTKSMVGGGDSTAPIINAEHWLLSSKARSELLLDSGWKLRKDQPDNIQTGAGALRIKVLEEMKPFWSGKETEYLVYIRSPGSAAEEYAGHVTMRYMKADETVELTQTESVLFISDNMKRELENNGMAPDANLAQIKKFYPIGLGTKYAHKGVGMAMLGLLQDDASKESAMAIFCYTSRHETLGKKLVMSGYAEFGDEPLYLKILVRK